MDDCSQPDGEHQPPWPFRMKSRTDSLENQAPGLPGTGPPSLPHIELAIRHIAETCSTGISLQKLPSTNRSMQAAQSDIVEAATNLNDSAFNIATHSRTMTHHLSESVQSFSRAYTSFIDTGLSLAAVSKDTDMQSNIIGRLRSVSMVASQLLEAAKSVSIEPNSLGAKKVLPQAARAVIESTNEMISICTMSTPDQRVADSDHRQKQFQGRRSRLCASIAQRSWGPCGSRRRSGFSSQYREFAKQKRQVQSRLDYNLAKRYIVRDADTDAGRDKQPHQTLTSVETLHSQQTSSFSAQAEVDSSQKSCSYDSGELEQEIFDCEQECLELAISSSRIRNKTSEAMPSSRNRNKTIEELDSQCKAKVGSMEYRAESAPQSTLTAREVLVSSDNQHLQPSTSLPSCKIIPRTSVHQEKKQSTKEIERKRKDTFKTKVRFNEVVETLDLNNKRGSEKINDGLEGTKLTGRKSLRKAILEDALEKRPVFEYQKRRGRNNDSFEGTSDTRGKMKSKGKTVSNVQDSKKFSFCADELHAHLNRSKTNTICDTEAQQMNQDNAQDRTETLVKSEVDETTTVMKDMLSEAEKCPKSNTQSHENGQEGNSMVEEKNKDVLNKMSCNEHKMPSKKKQTKQKSMRTKSMKNLANPISQSGVTVPLAGDDDAPIMELKPKSEKHIDRSLHSVKEENSDSTGEVFLDNEIETLDLLDDILRKDLTESKELIAVSREEVSQLDDHKLLKDLLEQSQCQIKNPAPISHENKGALQPNLNEFNFDCTPEMAETDMSRFWDKAIDDFLKFNADHFVLPENINSDFPNPDSFSQSAAATKSDSTELSRKALLESSREKPDSPPPVLQPFDGPDMPRAEEKRKAGNAKTGASRKLVESKSHLRVKPYWEMKLAVNNKFDREKKLFAAAKRFLGENFGKQMQEKRKSHKPRSKTSDEQIPVQNKRNIFASLNACSRDNIDCLGVTDKPDSKTGSESGTKTGQCSESPSVDATQHGSSGERNKSADIDLVSKDDQTNRLCTPTINKEKYPSLELVDIMKSFVDVTTDQAAMETKLVDKVLGTSKSMRVTLLRKTRRRTLGPKTWKSLHCTLESTPKRKRGRPRKNVSIFKTIPQRKTNMKESAQPPYQTTSLRENLKTIPNRSLEEELCSDSDTSSEEDIKEGAEKDLPSHIKTFNQSKTSDKIGICDNSVGPYVKHKSCGVQQQQQQQQQGARHKCGYCGNVESSKVRLQIHLKEVHPHRCYKCKTLFPDKESYLDHFWSHFNIVYRCDLCSMKFMNKSIRDQHLQGQKHMKKELEHKQRQQQTAVLEAELDMALTSIMETESAESATSNPTLTVEDACSTSYENPTAMPEYLVASIDGTDSIPRNHPDRPDNPSSILEHFETGMDCTDDSVLDNFLGRPDNPILTLELLEPEILDPYLTLQSSITPDQVWPQELPNKLGDSDFDVFLLDDPSMDQKAEDNENVLEIIIPDDEEASDTDILCRIASSFSLFDTFRDA